MTLPRVGNGELARLLTPRERSVLAAVREFGSDPERIHDQLKWRLGRRAPSVEEIRRTLASARGKIQALVEGAEPPRPEPPRGPNPTTSGKRVTFPGHVTRPPEKEADMAAGEERPTGSQVPENPPERGGEPTTAEGFAHRIERETRREADRVLEELARLRFDAHQVVRVMRALKLEVPQELNALTGGAAPAAKAPAVEDPAEPETAPAGPPSEPPKRPGAPVGEPPERERPQEPPKGRVEAPSGDDAQRGRGTAPERAAKPESGTDAPREAARRAAGETFRLEAPVPEELRTEQAAEAALREMRRDITTGKVAQRFKTSTRVTAERIIRYFSAKGVLVPQEVTAGSTQVTWGISGVVADVRDKLPVPAAGWEAAPAWKDADPDRRGMAAELVARTQAALVAVLEMEARPLVAREIMEEFEMRTGQDLPFARVGDYLRDCERAGLIKRTGKARRAKGQTAGRTSFEYVGVADAPPTPAEASLPEVGKEDWPLCEDVRDAVAARGDGAVSPRQVADAIEKKTGRRTNIGVVTARMKELVEQGILTDRSVADLYLFEYRKPDGPGAAASLERERAAESALTNGNGGGAPVPGTGQPMRAGNAFAQALVNDCRRLGATVIKAGSGHLRVSYGGRETIIASTPNSTGVKKDRARVKRVLGLAV